MKNMRKILGLVIVVTMVMGIIVLPTTVSAVDVNLLRETMSGRIMTGDNTESSSTTASRTSVGSVAYMNDAIGATDNTGAWNTYSNARFTWVEVNFGETVNMNSVKLYKDNIYSSSYTCIIKTKNLSTDAWTTVANGSDPNGKNKSLTIPFGSTIQAKYIRIEATWNGPPRFTEIEIFGMDIYAVQASMQANFSNLQIVKKDNTSIAVTANFQNNKLTDIQASIVLAVYEVKHSKIIGTKMIDSKFYKSGTTSLEPLYFVFPETIGEFYIKLFAMQSLNTISPTVIAEEYSFGGVPIAHTTANPSIDIEYMFDGNVDNMWVSKSVTGTENISVTFDFGTQMTFDKVKIIQDTTNVESYTLIAKNNLYDVGINIATTTLKNTYNVFEFEPIRYQYLIFSANIKNGTAKIKEFQVINSNGIEKGFSTYFCNNSELPRYSPNTYTRMKPIIGNWIAMINNIAYAMKDEKRVSLSTVPFKENGILYVPVDFSINAMGGQSAFTDNRLKINIGTKKIDIGNDIFKTRNNIFYVPIDVLEKIGLYVWYTNLFDMVIISQLPNPIVFQFNMKHGDGLTVTQIAEEIISAKPTANEIINEFNKNGKTHPSLLFNQNDFDNLKQGVNTNPQWMAYADKIINEAQNSYATPIITATGSKIDSNQTNSLTSFIIKMKIMYVLTEDEKYPKRVWQELEEFMKYTDWYENSVTSHLVTAYGANAVAFAFDWFYDYWTDEQKQTLLNLITTHVFIPIGNGYTNNSWWWKYSTNNWNTVCNGGFGLSALAFMGENAETNTLVANIAANAIEGLPISWSGFAPTGGSEEGVNYGTMDFEFGMQMVTQLTNMFGHSYGLGNYPGLADFLLSGTYLTGSNGTWNTGDMSAWPWKSKISMVAGRYFNSPEIIYNHTVRNNKRNEFDIYSLMLFPQIDMSYKYKQNDYRISGIETAAMHTNLSALNDFSFMLKGSVDRGHGDLDSGEFNLQSDGIRWTYDYGTDNYGLPEYFGNKRWDYYRRRTDGQNALVFNNDNTPNQNPSAFAPLTYFRSGDDYAVGKVDLTKVYENKVNKVNRTAILDKTHRIALLRDEIESNIPTDMFWLMHTSKVTYTFINDRTVILGAIGKSNRLWVSIIEGRDDLKFETAPAAPLPGSPPTNINENPMPTDVTRLMIHGVNIKNEVITVMFYPLKIGETKPPFIPNISIDYIAK